MAKAALQDEQGIVASDFEMYLPRPSYTWHTLQALSRDYPDRQFVLMIGGDNWQLFDRWYKADEIKANYEIVVYTRTPSDPGFIDISSTAIRQRIHDGRSIHGLVPDVVEEIILKNGYYA
jgi:nicotinate-nucleotide adenylyltransferase